MISAILVWRPTEFSPKTKKNVDLKHEKHIILTSFDETCRVPKAFQRIFNYNVLRIEILKTSTQG